MPYGVYISHLIRFARVLTKNGYDPTTLQPATYSLLFIDHFRVCSYASRFSEAVLKKRSSYCPSLGVVSVCMCACVCRLQTLTLSITSEQMKLSFSNLTHLFTITTITKGHKSVMLFNKSYAPLILKQITTDR